MQFIQGNNRHQTYFTTLEQQVTSDNLVRLIDAFIDKPGLKKVILLPHRKTCSCSLLHFISIQLRAEGIAK